MQTDARKRANARYQKANVRQMNLKFAPPEHDLLDWVRSQPNAAGYVKALIRADMERSRGR